jgi:hypothetical protein
MMLKWSLFPNVPHVKDNEFKGSYIRKIFFDTEDELEIVRGVYWHEPEEEDTSLWTPFGDNSQLRTEYIC